MIIVILFFLSILDRYSALCLRQSEIRVKLSEKTHLYRNYKFHAFMRSLDNLDYHYYSEYFDF